MRAGWFPGMMSQGIGCGSIYDPNSPTGETSVLGSLQMCVQVGVWIFGWEGEVLICTIVVKPTVFLRDKVLIKCRQTHKS